jgi:hypothetical protein
MSDQEVGGCTQVECRKLYACRFERDSSRLRGKKEIPRGVAALIDLAAWPDEDI